MTDELTTWTAPAIDEEHLRRLAERLLNNGLRSQEIGGGKSHAALKAHAAYMEAHAIVATLGLVSSSSTIIFACHDALQGRPEPAKTGRHPGDLQYKADVDVWTEWRKAVVDDVMLRLGWSKPEHVATARQVLTGGESKVTCTCGWEAGFPALGNAALAAEQHVKLKYATCEGCGTRIRSVDGKTWTHDRPLNDGGAYPPCRPTPAVAR